MKTNFTFLCVLDNYSQTIAQELSDKLEMCTVNINEMIQFELGDAEKVLHTLGDKEGKKQISKCEAKVIKNAVDFENTIIVINPLTLINNKNFEQVVNTSYTIYLQISPKYFEARAKYSGDKINEEFTGIAFSERDKEYVNISDIVLNCSKYKEHKSCKKLYSIIKKFIKKKLREESKNIVTTN